MSLNAIYGADDASWIALSVRQESEARALIMCDQRSTRNHSSHSDYRHTTHHRHVNLPLVWDLHPIIIMNWFPSLLSPQFYQSILPCGVALVKTHWSALMICASYQLDNLKPQMTFRRGNSSTNFHGDQGFLSLPANHSRPTKASFSLSPPDTQPTWLPLRG